MKAKSRPTFRRSRRTESKSGGVRTRAERVHRKWRWHYHALQRLRDHLLDDLCLKLRETAEPIGPHGTDPADGASDESDRSLTVALLSGEHDALREVDAAMGRIRDGTYGICERSGKRIPLQRLRAVPWTRFTKEVEDSLEKDRGIRSALLAPIGSVQGTESGVPAHGDGPGHEKMQASAKRKKHTRAAAGKLRGKRATR